MVNRYITTTLPYVNADPHIGFAIEILQADTLARFWRLRGDDVFFSTGTDEHGQKIFQKADEQGREVQEYVDYYANEFAKLKEALGLSYDNFIRTTDASHVAAAQELWQRCYDKGDIYKKAYKGLYCVGDEAFLKESELVNGKCPNHPNMNPVEIEEENYFFALSKYQNQLLEYLLQEGVVVPEWRRKEVLAFVGGGLEDVSVSRQKERMSWGVEVPNDDTQVMYVWFDALTNYISTLGWPEGENFTKFWLNGKTVQVAGKDQLRFQSIMFQAMLMSADITPTDQIFYHGFVNWGGQKMSKSLGNVVSPYELIDRYGSEATRYMLLRHIHPTEDSDVTWERLDEWYTAHLVNGIGNLVARVMTLAEKHLDTPVEIPVFETDAVFEEKLQAFDFMGALDYVFEYVEKADEYMTKHEPYKTIKDEATAEKAKGEIRNLVEQVGRIGYYLVPFMPETASGIQRAVAENTKPENLFPRLT